MPLQFIDISVPVTSNMVTWPTDPPVKILTSTGDYAGLTFTLSRLHFGSHTGTHVDAPRHAGVGPGTVDDMPLATLIGPAHVIDVRGTTEITEDILIAAGAGAQPRLLLHTNNSAWIRTGPIPDVSAHLTKEAAQWLVDRGVLLLGIDGLTVDAPDTTVAHVALLKAGVVILETINLSQVDAGEYELICLPLRLAGADGAPARAVLRTL